MERNNKGEVVTASRICKHCGNIFNTLVDEKHDVCPECMRNIREKESSDGN